MPKRHLSWSCSKCRKRFVDYDAAEDCEFDHVIQPAIEATQKAIADAFNKQFGPAQRRSHDD